MTEKELDDYKFTIDICLKFLPSDTHPAHYERLRKMKSILEWEYRRTVNPHPSEKYYNKRN